MDTQFWIILFFLILISGLLITVLGLAFYIVFTNNNAKTDSAKNTEAIKKNAAPCTIDAPPLVNCHHHDKIQAQAFCSICKLALCEDCVRDDKNIYFCQDHFQLYLQSDWVELETVTTNPNHPEDGMYIYEFKEKIWLENNTPTFVTIHYKIDVESDHIESELKLMARKEEKKFLKEKISPLKH
ncbi:MAG: hypothetical protein HN576_17470 [Bacteriovoracaceae bacterium]|jgi:hypothetical protein|nr:hypothetical protein [Bacteriovoracaceae bacterium]